MLRFYTTTRNKTGLAVNIQSKITLPQPETRVVQQYLFDKSNHAHFVSIMMQIGPQARSKFHGSQLWCCGENTSPC